MARKGGGGEEALLVTVEVAARRLSVSPGTLRNWLSEGRLPAGVAVKLGGSRRFHWPSLLAFIEHLRCGQGIEDGGRGGDEE